MVSQIPDEDLPSGVQIARFMRTTMRIGITGIGFEEIVYDTHTTDSEGVVRYKKYLDREDTIPPEDAQDGQFDLEDVTPKNMVTKVGHEDEISSRSILDTEEMYLMTWDHAASIYVMDADEMLRTLSAILSQNDRLRPEDIPTDRAELFSDSSSYKSPPSDVQSKSESGTPKKISSGDEEEATDRAAKAPPTVSN